MLYIRVVDFSGVHSYIPWLRYKMGQKSATQTLYFVDRFMLHFLWLAVVVWGYATIFCLHSGGHMPVSVSGRHTPFSNFPLSSGSGLGVVVELVAQLEQTV